MTSIMVFFANSSDATAFSSVKGESLSEAGWKEPVIQATQSRHPSSHVSCWSPQKHLAFFLYFLNVFKMGPSICQKKCAPLGIATMVGTPQVLPLLCLCIWLLCKLENLHRRDWVSRLTNFSLLCWFLICKHIYILQRECSKLWFSPWIFLVQIRT